MNRCLHAATLEKGPVPREPVLDALEERVLSNTPTTAKVEQPEAKSSSW